ncbi:hypothetical protein EDD36DRAFT_23027 [Exophiala viscosa]|uniref:Uncharacterized protein n=1 Tax=Exophiala viscosa TaxID=2486360 RepID=A0AAN6E6J3_9EURO|nr:hypothetical protein EDD36DRAFT_23027 [Exophiala viscosa]
MRPSLQIEVTTSASVELPRSSSVVSDHEVQSKPSSPAEARPPGYVPVLPAIFVMWVGRQEKLGRPAIIPDSIWRNRIFTTVCIDIFLAWGAANARESLFSFFFQDGQRLSATQAWLRFHPAPMAGLITNVFMGLAIHKINANWAVILIRLSRALHLSWQP